MSKFFGASSESESDVDSGSSSDSDPEPEQQKGRTKPAAFVFSDDEEDTKRVVRTQKDKRFDEMQTIIKQMKNHKKIRDMAKVLEVFEELDRAYQKSRKVIESEGFPRFVVRCLVDLEDFIGQIWDDKDARKKMSKINSKGLATIRQRIRKHNREPPFEAEIAKYRENPDAAGEAEEEDDDEFGGDSKEATPIESEKQARAEDSDEDDWGSETESESSSSSSDDDEDDPAKRALKFLKRELTKEEKEKKKAKDEERTKKREERKKKEDSADGLFYDGKTWFDKNMANPTFDYSLCEIHDDWVACPNSMQIRTMKIWSPNRGSLTVSSTQTATVPYRNLPRVQWYGGLYSCGSGLDAGPFGDCPLYSTPTGYTFLVAGMSVQINVPSYSGALSDLFTVEYSETHLPETTISLSITGDSKFSFNNCVVSSKHDRRYTSAFGAMFPNSGAAWDCKSGGWQIQHSRNEFLNVFVAEFPHSGERYATCSAEDCDPKYSVYDPLCWNDGSDTPGCNHLGRCCRICNLKGYRKCEDRDTIYNGEAITVNPEEVGIAWEVLSKPQVCHENNCSPGWQYQYKCLLEHGKPGGCDASGTAEKACCQICNQANLPPCGTGYPPVNIPEAPAGGWLPWQGDIPVPSIPAGSRYVPRSPDSPIPSTSSTSTTSTSTSTTSTTTSTSTSTTSTSSPTQHHEPVVGCRTTCEGVVMDNGQEACAYAKQYCGDQLVATNLNGRTVPTCFSPNSDTCQAWKTVGCDLRLCGKIQASNPTTTSLSTILTTPTTSHQPNHPVIGCQTSCAGVLMDNGEEACVFGRKYCGDQFVATELKGATIPTCFSPRSNHCEMWGRLGCDLRSCEVETREVALLLQNGGNDEMQNKAIGT